MHINQENRPVFVYDCIRQAKASETDDNLWVHDTDLPVNHTFIFLCVIPQTRYIRASVAAAFIDIHITQRRVAGISGLN